MHILIADDSSAIQQRLVKIVSRIHNTRIVGLAGNGIEALNLTRDAKPDVVLLDLNMPFMGGIEVIRTIKKDYPATIILVLTNFATSSHKDSCMKLGVKYFFDKTIEFEQAIDAIEELALKIN